MNEQQIRAHITSEQGEAARRTFAILTAWVHAHPTQALAVSLTDTGKFQLEAISKPSSTGTKFLGESIQEVCAQAAQTIQFSDGELGASS